MYAQGIVAQRLRFVAGQIPLDPVTGTIVSGDIVAQADRVMLNLTAILKEAGAGWADVVKTTIYVSDMAEYARVDEVYARHLGGARPARSTVAVSGLPRGVLLEMDAIAVVE